MAVSELVPFDEGYGESTEQQIGASEFHTLIPVFKNNHGAVVVKVVMSDDSRVTYRRLDMQSCGGKQWQIRGPLTYIVECKNAGCDLDDGA